MERKCDLGDGIEVRPSRRYGQLAMAVADEQRPHPSLLFSRRRRDDRRLPNRRGAISHASSRAASPFNKASWVLGRTLFKAAAVLLGSTPLFLFLGPGASLAPQKLPHTRGQLYMARRHPREGSERAVASIHMQVSALPPTHSCTSLPHLSLSFS